MSLLSAISSLLGSVGDGVIAGANRRKRLYHTRGMQDGHAGFSRVKAVMWHDARTTNEPHETASCSRFELSVGDDVAHDFTKA